MPRAAVATPEARRERLEAVECWRFPPPPTTSVRTDHFIVLPGRELMVSVYGAPVSTYNQRLCCAALAERRCCMSPTADDQSGPNDR